MEIFTDTHKVRLKDIPNVRKINFALRINYSLLSEMFELYPNVPENNFSLVNDEYLYYKFD